MVRYYDSQNVELVNAYLMDKTSGGKFAFGKHIKLDWEGFAPADAKEWKDKGFSPSEAFAWKKIGISSDAAMQWSKAKISPAAVAEWNKAGFDVNTAAERKNGFEPAEAKEWRAGFKNADEALQWKNAGLDPATARSLKKRGIGPGEAKGLEKQRSSIVSDLCTHYEKLSVVNQAINRQYETDLATGTTNLYERRQLGAAKLYIEEEIGRLRNEYKKLSGGDFSRKKQCE